MNMAFRVRACVALCIGALLCVVGVGAATVERDVQQDMNQHRTTYETMMESVRRDVRKRATDFEWAEFERAGAWPSGFDVKPLQERAGKAAQQLLEGYIKLIQRANRKELPELSLALKNERERFESQSDLVPWGENLVAGLPEEERRLEFGGDVADRLSLKLPIADNYRVEVEARQVEPASELVFGLPMGDGSVIERRATARGDGKIRVLASVRGVDPSFEMGIPRVQPPAGFDGAIAGALAMRAQGGAVVVESVRVKPMIEGRPERFEASARPERFVPAKPAAPKQAPAAPVADPFQVGFKWRGEWRCVWALHLGPIVCDIIVRKREGDRVVLEILSDVQFHLLIEGDLVNGQVNVDRMVDHHRRRDFRLERGSIHAGGEHLSIDIECRSYSHENKGEIVKLQIHKAKSIDVVPQGPPPKW